MKYDIVIIGGGIAGLSAAARLAPHADVVVLEQEPALGYHSSGRSAALFEENYGAPSVVSLNAASREFLTTIGGGVLSPRGFLLIGSDGNEAAFCADCAALKIEAISRAEAEALVPILNRDTTSQFAYHADAWDIDTDKLLQAYARMARSHGATILTNAEALTITRDETAWRINTPTGDIKGKLLVNASGSWADTIAQRAGVEPLGLQPYRRSIAQVPAPGGHDVSRWPIMFGPGETWYAKPEAGTLLISPADEDPVPPQDAWAEDMVLAEGIARYQEVVTEEVTRVTSNWAGLRTFAPDRNLVIGRDANQPDFFWLAGQGGYGMQSSSGASQLAADLILNRAPNHDAAIVASLDPARF